MRIIVIILLLVIFITNYLKIRGAEAPLIYIKESLKEYMFY